MLRIRQICSHPSTRIYCGPAVIPIAGLAIAAVGAGVSVASSVSASRYQAGVQANNQKIAEYNATVAAQKGQQMESAKKAQTTQMIAEERAKAGASGLDANTGSPLRIQSDTARLGDIDAMTIRSNAAREVYGYHVQGLSYAGQAALDESTANNAAIGGALNTFGSLIGDASTVSQKWARPSTPANPLIEA